MTRRIRIIGVSILLILILVMSAFAAQSPIPEVEVSIEPQLVKLNIDYVETDDPDELSTLSQTCLDMMSTAHQMAECARTLGYPEESVVISEASAIWWGYHDCYVDYTRKLVELKELEALKEFEKQKELEALEEQKQQEKLNKYAEYPTSGIIWDYLIETLGYNDYVSAGIMGNIMVECGGGTLAVDPLLYSYGSGYYYGICQWNKSAYPEVRGQDLDYQLQYLANTIKYELNTYGYMYSKGYKYDDFLNMTDAKAAALMFAKSYERCGSSTYGLRQQCAIDAYNYFSVSS